MCNAREAGLRRVTQDALRLASPRYRASAVTRKVTPVLRKVAKLTKAHILRTPGTGLAHQPATERNPGWKEGRE